MQTNRGPLNLDEFVDEGVDEEYELVLTGKGGARSDSSAGKSKVWMDKYTDHELDDEIVKHQSYLRTLLLKDPKPMRKKIKALEDERRRRQEKKQEKPSSERRGHSVDGGASGGRSRTTRSASKSKSINDLHFKTDGSGRTSRGDGGYERLFSDEIEIMNSPLKQRSLNTDGSAFDGLKDTSRVFSGTQAGPGPRQGLRSGSKQFCSECSDGSGDFTCRDCKPSLFYAKKPKRSSALESPKRNSSPGPAVRRKGNGVNKRARQGGDGRDSPEKIVELMSSEDEDVKKTQDTFADCQIASHRRGHGTRSSFLSGSEGVRIAYPCGNDPEAVEVMYQDLHRLEPLEFLNDTVIDFYIKFIQRPENLPVEDKNKFHFFNSFFYKKLSEIVGGQNKKCLPDLSKLRKWTRGTNIFKKEYLFVPIHDKWHWSLAIICHPGASIDNTVSQRCILHLDSMNPGHKSNSVFRLLRTYLVAEWDHQVEKDDDYFEEIRPDEITTKKVPVPQQENESDCGLFLLHYIETFIKQAPASFRLSDVDEGRLFGLDWFEPQQASALRRGLKDLLEDLFKPAETSGATEAPPAAIEIAERTESLSPLNLDELVKGNGIKHVNSSAILGMECERSPGQPSATADLLNRHCSPTACVASVDLSSGVSTPESLEADGAQQRASDALVVIDMGEGGSRACSQADTVDLRRPDELPPTSLLGSFGELESRAGSLLLSGGSADKTQSKACTSDLEAHAKSGIPLVVDLTS